MSMKIIFHDELWEPSTPAAKFLLNNFVPRTIDACAYEFGTIEGMYIKGAPDIDILMILNLQPHNGHFQLFMNALEKLAHKTRKKVRILSFMNERLYLHIKKRSGWISPVHTMDCLEYNPEIKG